MEPSRPSPSTQQQPPPQGQPHELAMNVERLPESISFRVIVDDVQPAIDGGRFPVKRTVGERLAVSAVIFADGHDVLAGVLKFRDARTAMPGEWRETPLTFAGNDRWEASFTPATLGEWEYTVEAWVDRYRTWLHGLVAKADAGQDVASELLEGAELVQAPVQAAHGGGAAAAAKDVAAAAGSDRAEEDLNC